MWVWMCFDMNVDRQAVVHDREHGIIQMVKSTEMAFCLENQLFRILNGSFSVRYSPSVRMWKKSPSTLENNFEWLVKRYIFYILLALIIEMNGKLKN